MDITSVCEFLSKKTNEGGSMTMQKTMMAKWKQCKSASIYGCFLGAILSVACVIPMIAAKLFKRKEASVLPVFKKK